MILSLSLSLSLSLVHLSSYLDHTGSQCRVALPGVTTEGKGVFGEQRRISGREREGECQFSETFTLNID